MSSKTEAEDVGAELVGRLQAAFVGGAELIAVQAGYRFGWYELLARHGPMTAGDVSRLSGTGPRFTKEWLLQQTSAGIVDTDLSGSEPNFHLSPETIAVLLGSPESGENTVARTFAEMFATFAPLAHRFVDAWQRDQSALLDNDRVIQAEGQAMMTALTARDLPGRLAQISALADLAELARQEREAARVRRAQPDHPTRSFPTRGMGL